MPNTKTFDTISLMNNAIPTISIIVPIYNIDKYLDECLKSIQQQVEISFEVLMIDDGSTDGSAKICHEYESKDNRFHYVYKENGGLSDARNVGLQHAQGQWIAFVDADDSIHPQMMKKLYDACVMNDAQIAICDMEYQWPDGTKKFSSGGEFTFGSIEEHPSWVLMNNSACNKLYEKNVFESMSFPKDKYYEDLYLIPCLLYRAKRIVKVNGPLYYYRQREGSIAHSVNDKIFEVYDAIDHVLDYVANHGGSEQVLKEIRHLYIIHGLELTTIRIKDSYLKESRNMYFKQNISRLRQSYPSFQSDSYYRRASWKEKWIWFLMIHGKEDLALRLYDRK